MINVVILAAGQGKRMRSSLPKVLQPLAGMPMEEIYGGHNIIKAFNKEEDVIATFKRDNDILYTSAWKSQFLSGMMMPIMQFVGNLGYVGEVI